MNTHHITSYIRIGIIGLLLFFAATTSAGNPAVPNPGGFSANNTPFPVVVDGTTQIKGDDAVSTGGGLSVEAFTGYQNSSFKKTVGVQGILTGGDSSDQDSALAIGDTTHAVDLSVLGTTYAQDGYLRSQTIVDASGPRLCANTNGEIIVCPTTIQSATLRIEKTDTGTLPSSLTVTLSGLSPIVLGPSDHNLILDIAPGGYPFTVSCRYNPDMIGGVPSVDTVPRSVTPDSRVLSVSSGGIGTIIVECSNP